MWSRMYVTSYVLTRHLWTYTIEFESVYMCRTCIVRSRTVRLLSCYFVYTCLIKGHSPTYGHAILFILAWSKDTVQPMVMLFCLYLLDQRTRSNLLTHCLLGISNVIWIFRSDHIRVYLQCCCHLVKYTSLLIIWQHWFRPWLGTIRQQATSWASVCHGSIPINGITRPQWVKGRS